MANDNPLLGKRKGRAPIGYLNTRYICLKCETEIDDEARPYVELEELREGDDAGVPYVCYKCGKELKPVNDPIQVEA